MLSSLRVHAGSRARGRFFYRRSVLAEISVEEKLGSRGSYTNRDLIFWLCMQHAHAEGNYIPDLDILRMRKKQTPDFAIAARGKP